MPRVPQAADVPALAVVRRGATVSARTARQGTDTKSPSALTDDLVSVLIRAEEPIGRYGVPGSREPGRAI